MKTLVTMGRLTFAIAVSLVLNASAFGQPSAPASSKPEPAQTVRRLQISNKPWTGDFDRMLDRRIIRVLAPYSRSLYFIDNGREMGISAENVRDFERWINKKYAKKLGNRPLTVFIICTTRDKLLPGIAQGLGDIAAANLTVTEERLKTVDFASPAAHPRVKELIVTGPRSPKIASTDDLAGKTVHVRKTSSYYESLRALNERFKKVGKPAIELVLVPDALEDEDMMEMVNAGLLQAIVVDDWKAKMWAQILPKIRVNEQAAVRESGRLGWAIRKGSPKLEAEILDFHQNYLKNLGVSAYRLKKYIGAYSAVAGPLDAVVIVSATGGSDWQIRELTLTGMEGFGIRLDRERNRRVAADPVDIRAEGSRVGILVLPTNEEHILATEAAALLAHGWHASDLCT